MRALIPFAVTAALLAAACGGDGNDDAEPTSDHNEPFMDASAPQLDDTAYVAALCDGVEGYMAVIQSKGEEEVRTARQEFEAKVRSLHPPEGTEAFQRDFVAYIDGAQSDPTLLLTTDPPLPTGELRTRLADAEAGADCQYQLFTRSDATPAPSATPGG
jgi:hypothetical protein